MKLNQLTLTVFLWSSALAGALKYAGLSVGFPFIHLLPKVALAAVTFWPFASGRATRAQWSILTMFVLSFGIAIINGAPFKQACFGLWVLIPLLFGFMQAETVLSLSTRRALFWILAVSLLGELINHFQAMPWEKMTISFGDYTSSVSRDWTDNSVKRLAGLATSSIDLSIIIAVASCFMMIGQRAMLARTMIVVVASVAILATTMKTAAAAFVFAALPLWINSRFVRRMTGVVAVGAVLTATIVPLIAWSAPGFTSLLETGFLKGRDTLQMRLDVVWPRVLDYVVSQHIGPGGLGLGGLGAANEFGKRPFEYAYVDNFYLYLLCVGGVFGAIFIASLLIKLMARTLSTKAVPLDMAGSMLVFFAIYGCSQVAIETSVGALFFGAAMAAASRAKRSLPLRARVARSGIQSQLVSVAALSPPGVGAKSA